MNIEIDLQALADKITADVIQKISRERNTPDEKRWITNQELQEILKISPGTAQNYRIRGWLSFVKIGGRIFYEMKDIETLLLEHKKNPLSPKEGGKV